MKPTAGPDVDPDQQTTDGGVAGPGGATAVSNSSTGIGAVDGVRPDLADAIGLGPVEPPTDTGINPYATASESTGIRGGATTGRTETSTVGAARRAKLRQRVRGATPPRRISAQSSPGSGAFGGPPNGSRGSSSSAATAADSSTLTQNAATTGAGGGSVQNVGSSGGGFTRLARRGGAAARTAARPRGRPQQARPVPETHRSQGPKSGPHRAKPSGAAARHQSSGADQDPHSQPDEQTAPEAPPAGAEARAQVEPGDTKAGADQDPRSQADEQTAPEAPPAGAEASTQADPGDTKAGADQDPRSQADEQTAPDAPPAGAEASTQADPGDTKAAADQDPRSQADEQTATAEHSDPLGMINVTALSSAIVDPVPQLAASPDATVLDHTLAGGAFHTVASGAIPDPRASEAGIAPAGEPPVDHASIIIPDTDLTAIGGEPDIDHAAMAHVDLGAPEPADTAPEHHDDATPDHIDVPFGGPLDDGLG